MLNTDSIVNNYPREASVFSQVDTINENDEDENAYEEFGTLPEEQELLTDSRTASRNSKYGRPMNAMSMEIDNIFSYRNPMLGSPKDKKNDNYEMNMLAS